MGFYVDGRRYDECLDLIAGWLNPAGEESREGRYFVCANPHSLETARVDADMAAAIAEADLVIPDGIGVVLASTLLGGRIRNRITGTMIFSGVSELLNRRAGSAYFLGSTSLVLDRIRSRLSTEYPRVRIAGMAAPPFAPTIQPRISDQLIDDINRTSPDVLWVGMTAPKQEKWIHQNRHRIRARVLGPIGAAFDFYAGTVRRASPWFQDHGLEWLPRLLREPQRLWRRSLISGPRFLVRALLDGSSRAVDR